MSRVGCLKSNASMHGNIEIVVIYIIHCTPHLYPAKMKRPDLTVMFYTLSMQLPLWPSFLRYCFDSSLSNADEDINAQTRLKLIYGVDKLRMINSYLTSVVSLIQMKMKTHDNIVTALLGTVLTKLIDNPL